MNPFLSDSVNISLHDSGWWHLSDSVAVSRLPLWDTLRQTFARTGWRQAEVWLKSRGWRLPTKVELDAMRAASLHIAPYTMPTAAMLSDVGIATSDVAGIDSYRNAHMRSLLWAEAHDREVLSRIANANWDGVSPVFNAGKHWGAGGYIYGWDDIQPWSAAHRNYEHTDYGTTIVAARDVAHTGVAVQGDADAPILGYGSTSGDVRAWQRMLLRLGYSLGGFGATGGFYGLTLEATKQFQADHHVVVDGKVGPETRGAAVAALAGDGDTDPAPDSSPSPRVPPTDPFERLPAIKTKATAEEIYEALRLAWPSVVGGEPSRESLLVVLAVWAHETGLGQSMVCWSFGNARTTPSNGAYCWTMFSTTEILSAPTARAYVARAGPRADGKGRDAEIVGSRDSGHKVVRFWPDNVGSCFRAFRTIGDGARDYIELMHGRFRSVWPAIEAGDPTDLAKRMKSAHYYTASAASYARALRLHYAALDSQIPE